MSFSSTPAADERVDDGLHLGGRLILGVGERGLG